jgi:hypothetical protein
MRFMPHQYLFAFIVLCPALKEFARDASDLVLAVPQVFILLTPLRLKLLHPGLQLDHLWYTDTTEMMI